MPTRRRICIVISVALAALASAEQRMSAQGALKIVPDIHLYAVSGTVVDGNHVSVHGDFVSWSYVALSGLHGLGWIVGLLALACLLFHRRDFA